MNPIHECGREMRCVKTGRVIVCHDGPPFHVRSGDTFECPDCLVMVTVAAPAAFTSRVIPNDALTILRTDP